MKIQVEIKQGAGDVALARWLTSVLREELGCETTFLLDGVAVEVADLDDETTEVLDHCSATKVTVELERPS